MTNPEKSELRHLCREGYSFEQIRRMVSCSSGTIRKYLKTFAPQTTEEDGK